MKGTRECLARNTAIGRATGDVIAFLDDDAVPHNALGSRDYWPRAAIRGGGGRMGAPVLGDHQPDGSLQNVSVGSRLTTTRVSRDRRGP